VDPDRPRWDRINQQTANGIQEVVGSIPIGSTNVILPLLLWQQGQNDCASPKLIRGFRTAISGERWCCEVGSL
jgi:hypothetical protein